MNFSAFETGLGRRCASSIPVTCLPTPCAQFVGRGNFLKPEQGFIVPGSKRSEEIGREVVRTGEIQCCRVFWLYFGSGDMLSDTNIRVTSLDFSAEGSLVNAVWYRKYLSEGLLWF